MGRNVDWTLKIQVLISDFQDRNNLFALSDFAMLVTRETLAGVLRTPGPAKVKMIMQPGKARKQEPRRRLAAPELLQRYSEVRAFTERLAEPLSPEDCVIQSMPDVSPTRWHLAHTTWFFENFVLAGAQPGYKVFHPDYGFLFNSYYNSVGEQFPRPKRGLLSRPGLEEVLDYRSHVDNAIEALLGPGNANLGPEVLFVIELGLHHEQQHQELILTDIKHVLSQNPLFPAYRNRDPWNRPTSSPLEWLEFDEGLYQIGHQGVDFSFDNELPRHRVFLESFRLANRPTTNGEFLEFLEDGAYREPTLWLSEGWQRISADQWEAPLYWTKRNGQWFQFTHCGLQPLVPGEPVCHVSYFEADAFARWAQARLPTEAEWEVASTDLPMEGNFLHEQIPCPRLTPAAPAGDLQQMFGDVWEWTSSSYAPFPGYLPPRGALGEYNGKFMCNQYVLRGGSCATPKSHMRRTYRNFFPPDARWQFSGIRLAK